MENKNLTVRQTLTKIVSAAFEACGYDPELGAVTVSNRPDLCQFQCNGALSAAKRYKKNPAIIAQEVAAKLQDEPILEKAEFVPPGFLNINVADTYLIERAVKMDADARLDLPCAQEALSIVVDYGGPNVAKPLHIGHLRTAIIGESLVRLARFLGHKVVGDVHLGDWGLQMGLIIEGLRDKCPDLCYFDEAFTGPYPTEPPVTLDDLNELYPAASARSKTDEEFKAAAQKATGDLQNGRPGFVALWKHFLSLSVTDLKKSYAKLDVDFDKWLGESDAAPYVDEMLGILKDKGLSYISDGALIVDVAREDDEEEIPPIIIEKSDGSQLYGTTDLATILQRERDFDPDEIWYVVDNRQAMHFKQVFRCAHLASLVPEETRLMHIGFGTMNGKDGKPYKTRDGGVMRLSDLIKTVTDAAREKMAESATASVLSEEEAAACAEKIGIAALKIGDLINHRTKDYVFDLDRFLASEGKTGPYLQYAAVRIHSVLEKAEAQGFAPGELLPPASDTERALLLSLSSVGDTLLRAFSDHAPNGICEALFDLTGLFNRFYYENKILTCPNAAQRDSWLKLISITERMIALLLSLLAIQVPEKM